MRLSKLEMYIDILKVLAHTGPLKLTDIAYKSNVKGNMLKDHLVFLLKQGLVEERTFKKDSVVFAVTQRGINALKFFREPIQEISVIEKA